MLMGLCQVGLDLVYGDGPAGPCMGRCTGGAWHRCIGLEGLILDEVVVVVVVVESRGINIIVPSGI